MREVPVYITGLQYMLSDIAFFCPMRKAPVYITGLQYVE
jgi:hypothetical protein